MGLDTQQCLREVATRRTAEGERPRHLEMHGMGPTDVNPDWKCGGRRGFTSDHCAGTRKFEQRHSKQDPMSEAAPAHRTSAVRCTTQRLCNIGPARPEDAMPRVRRLVVGKRRTTDRNKLDRTCGAGGWGFPPTCAGTQRIEQVGRHTRRL